MLSRCVPIPMSSIFITIFRLRLKPIDSKPIPGAHGRSRISSARRKPTIFDAVSHLGSATATRVRAPGIAGE